MATKQRAWPNNAKNARDRSAEEALRALAALQPLLERQVTETERIRRVAVAVDAVNTIARHLESVGAQTRPS